MALARAASELLNNEFLPVAFDRRAEDIKAAWESADTVERREALHCELKALRNLRDALHAEARNEIKTGDGNG